MAAGRPWPRLLRNCLDQLGPGSLGATFGIVFMTDPVTEAADEILTALRAETGIVNWIGAAGQGIIAGNREIGAEGGIVLATLRLPEAAIRLFDLARPPSPSGGLGLVHAPVDMALCGESVRTLAEHTGAFLIGGRGGSIHQAAQFAGGVGAGSLVGALLAPPCSFAAGIAEAHKPLSPSHRITAALGGKVMRLDDTPAFEVLRQAAGDLLTRDPDSLRRRVQAALLDDSAQTVAMTGLCAVDEALGWIGLEAARPGGWLRFVLKSPDHAMTQLRATAQALLRRLGKRPQLALLYASTRRGPELFGPGVSEPGAVQAVLEGVPLIGLRTQEEVFEGRCLSHSAVLCLLG